MKKCPKCGTQSKKKFRQTRSEMICNCGYLWRSAKLYDYDTEKTR